MSLQYSVAVNNARLDAIETTISTSPTLEIRTGSPPANCAASDSGTVLSTISLPSDWMAAASSGAKAMSGTWSDSSADSGSSTSPGHFRIKSSGGTCHMQGTAGVGSGDLQVNGTFTAGQVFSVTSFTITAGNS